MLKIIVEFLIYLLAVFGALNIISLAADLIHNSKVKPKHPMRLILAVKDQEDTIEGIVRSIFLGDCLRKVIHIAELTIVDMDSSDNTLEILDRLRKEYGSINVVTWDEREKAFQDFSSNISKNNVYLKHVKN